LIGPESAPLPLSLLQAFVDIPHLPLTEDARDAQLCLDLIKHSTDPGYLSPRYPLWEQEFSGLLRSRHLQTITLQEMARCFRWWGGKVEGEDGEDTRIRSFLPGNYCDWREDRERMIEAGMRLDLVTDQLQASYPKYGDLFILN
jgi:hypothetical protein